MTEKRKVHRRNVERRAPKRGVTVRHDDDTVAKQTPKRVRKGAAGKRAAEAVDALPSKMRNGADKSTVSVTNALNGAHAETVQAVEQGNKEFLTNAQVDAHPLIGEKTLPKIAWYAWHQVKGANDPEFDQCVPPHKDKYLSHAQEILKGGAPQVGDTQLARFEQAVQRLNKGE